MSEDKPSVMAQLEQEFLIAQCISAMPSNVDGGPDITTPAPIRAKWAHKLYQQGVRVHLDQATHKAVSTGSGYTGNHGPVEIQSIDRDNIMTVLKDANPQLHKQLMALENGRGGKAAADAMLSALALKMPEEWRDKLAPKVDQFEAENTPPEQ